MAVAVEDGEVEVARQVEDIDGSETRGGGYKLDVGA